MTKFYVLVDIGNASNSGSGNIMPHFMRTGRTTRAIFVSAKLSAINCTLWLFLTKIWILILIQLVLS